MTEYINCTTILFVDMKDILTLIFCRNLLSFLKYVHLNTYSTRNSRHFAIFLDLLLSCDRFIFSIIQI